MRPERTLEHVGGVRDHELAEHGALHRRGTRVLRERVDVPSTPRDAIECPCRAAIYVVPTGASLKTALARRSWRSLYSAP
jgi:hypothetical protein